MKFIFGVDHTKHGCTVWMDSPSGFRSKARFRNGTCSALTSAEHWVWEKRQGIQQEAELIGKKIEFEVPPELDRVNDRKNITQPIDWWTAFEAQAQAEGLTLSAWIGEAAKARLPQKVAKKLSERPPAHRPKKKE